MKLEVPRFDGQDAIGWIFKITQFFDFHNTPENDRLTIASFYMDGPALSWFQWMTRNNLINSWHDLLLTLETRFAPSFYDDPRGALFKLTQTGSVNQYLNDFERIANRVMGLPHPFLLSCFISGLSPEIRREVQALQPISLPHATALAKIQEDKINDRRRTFRLNKPTASSTPTQNTSNNTFTFPTTQHSPNTTPSTSKVNFKKLSPEELISRREREPLLSPAIEEIASPPSPDPEAPAQLSLHAMSGSSNHNTIRVTGTINKHSVAVLVDGGSSHNFIQTRITKFLGLNPTPTHTPLRVMVGSGDTLECTQKCSQVPLSIQGQPFAVDLFVLPLGGAEIVLGAPWLKSLGPVLMDYSNLSMTFTLAGQPITFHSDAPFKPNDVSLPQMKRCVQTHALSSLFQLQILPSLSQQNEPVTITSPQPPELTSLLTNFTQLFDQPPKLPPNRHTNHQIHLIPNSSPVNVRPYRYPYHQKFEIEKQVTEMLSSGLIQPSRSPFSSPVLLVKKKDGSWRCCVDYRALNAITIKDRFPMPTIDELLDDLGGASWFSKLDLQQGFHQIRMSSDDIPKTAFRTHHGHYEYLVMPFGLCNAPSTFQATMNDLLQPFLRKFAAVFFDDILVFSPTLTDHLLHLEQVLNQLASADFSLKRSKCLFGQRQLEYLGHIISQHGIQADPSKLQAMVEWPTPTSITSLRGFLGLTGFYRKFIKGYASIATPLTNLLKKDSFFWNDEAQTAFDSLKKAMTEAPTLSVPNFSIPFDLETDASGKAMGAVLMQLSHPIAFFSKQFCPRLLRSSTYVRELHAITTAVKKWRQYLLGHPFTIHTDHKSLKELISQVIQTPEQQVYLSKLLGYDFKIQYKSGKANVVADALSRVDSPTCLTLTMPHFIFLDELRLSLQPSTEFTTLFHQVQQNPSTYPNYKTHQGLLFYKNKIWLNSSNPFKQRLLQEFHNSPLSGHMGIQKTYIRLHENFYWQGMRDDVKHFVSNCLTCQATKYETKKPAGLLQPLPVPSAIWEDLSLDFITGLPPSHGFTVILVVVDRFSKGAHFGALPSSFSAYKVAALFLDIICKHHGLPRSLVSDRDPIFISRFWRELFKLSGTKLRMSTSYHPETDGQTEVLNRILEQYLRSFVHSKPTHWHQFLPLAEWSYNTTSHSATGRSPFEITFGKPPPSIPSYLLGSSNVEAVDTLLTTRQHTITLLQRKLLKAQETMKFYADQKRRELSYAVGDFVYVKLRPYRQQSLTGSTYSKLSKRFYGPYKIVERIGPVAYKLELPPQSKIHPVFHCSLLKQHRGPLTAAPDDLPPSNVDNQPVIQPLAILDSRTDHNINPPQRQVLVQWLGLLPEDATWEDWNTLNSNFHLEDKVNFPAGSDDTIALHNNTTSHDTTMGLPKRIIKRPIHLEDYVTNLKPINNNM
ncbi:Ty3/gypsy retrotransposon protein [Trifolium pratense]|uniref:Ty3/gypsy retrotransposon protein n=1 Tax=Trifolium pratense TaxID=57577 RepID=A0A2K3MPM2_TRIPR|nr:Ty3/gypsy retrotransposon protein [Trifolium pratense]